MRARMNRGSAIRLSERGGGERGISHAIFFSSPVDLFDRRVDSPLRGVTSRREGSVTHTTRSSEKTRLSGGR